jgi:hypothetical protein
LVTNFIPHVCPQTIDCEGISPVQKKRARADYDIVHGDENESPILTTLRATLVAKTSPNVKKLSLSKIACIVSVFCAATAIF